MAGIVDLTEFSFGPCQVRADERALLVDGEPARIGARAFDLLCVLIERRDRVVSKNELLELVWPGLVVEENNLQVHISALRKLIGPAAIATVPGRGYRFTGLGQDDPADAPMSPQPTPSPAAAGANNLPAARSELFGRDADLDSLARLIAHHRLVTVVGTGGVGKTRVAQATAWRALADRKGGVWWVELAAVTDPQGVLDGVAKALGISLSAQSDVSALAARLADHDSLIVLDNCEHLVDAVATVAAILLRDTTSLGILATSQLPLNVTGEYLHRLAPLTLPEQEAVAMPAEGQGQGVLALFEARAKAVQPWFVIDAANRADVIEICRRLDGIPLAIELAASRVPLLGIDGLRQRLDQRFRLLTSSPRDAPARQQTLHAALAWSHSLLAPDEQRVFRRLGVCTGGFGLALAQGVGADDEEDEWAVLDTLGALVEKSLVVADAGAVPRYRLLESARAYALERLLEAQEVDLTRRRHAQTLLAMLEPALSAFQRDELASPHALAPWLPETDNLREALNWAERHDQGLFVALAGCSWWLWRPSGLPLEALLWCRRALPCMTAEQPASWRARLLLGYASASHQQEADKELTALNQAAQLFRTTQDRLGEYLSRVQLAKKLAWHGEPGLIGTTLREAEALWDPQWPETLRAGMLAARTYALEVAGRPSEGEPLMHELVALMRRSGSPSQLDYALMELAESLFVQGKAEAAITLRLEVADRTRQRDPHVASTNLANLGAALAFVGRTEEALQAARESLPGLKLNGRLCTFLDHFALIACLRGRFTEGARVLGRADASIASSGFSREESERRACDMAREALQRALPGEELRRRLDEGARLGDDAAADQALGD